MKAIVLSGFGGPEVLVPAEVPEPEPAPTDVVVRVLAAGINPIDLKTRQGGGAAEFFGPGPKILGWAALSSSSPSVARRPSAEAAADHGVRVAGIMVEPDRADLESIAALIGEGRLRARSPRSFPLREAAGAHRALESKEIRGKAVLVP